MKFLKKILDFFKRVDNLREAIEDNIAKALEKASQSELLDKGETLVLNAAIEAIEAYAAKQTGQSINLPNNTKKSIVDGIVNGHNKLQQKVAGIMRK